MKIQQISSLEKIENQFDLFIVDMVGVIYDEKDALPGTQKTISRLLDSGKKVILLTNNPRPNHIAQNKLVNLGFPENISIFTSGDATRFYISKNYPDAKIFHFGQHKNKDLFFDSESILVDDFKKANLVVLSLFTEESEDNSAFMSVLDEIAKTDIPVLCSNPDITAPFDGTTRKTAGYYSAYLEKKGKSVIYMGKPHKFIYDLIWEKFNLKSIDKAKAIMVGDTVGTDILGGNQYGIQTLLVLSGNTGEEIDTAITDASAYLKTLPQNFQPVYFSDRFE